MRINDQIIANDLPYILFYWFVKDAKRRNFASILLLELFNQDEVKCLPLLKLDFVEFESKHHLAHADNKKLLSWLRKRLKNHDAEHEQSAEKRIEFKQMILTMVHALLKKLNQTDDLNAISEEDQAALAELVKRLKLSETL